MTLTIAVRVTLSGEFEIEAETVAQAKVEAIRECKRKWDTAEVEAEVVKGGCDK